MKLTIYNEQRAFVSDYDENGYRRVTVKRGDEKILEIDTTDDRIDISLVVVGGFYIVSDRGSLERE